ncbi:DUF2269 family protein [Inquilinus limosus]|uniref:DUF2269 family protein n=1 Tax=Inquilinus limosus TaxID=171674 RepID=UPI000418CA74|nr:DUF2269 domain-containing protein [Inquilinus limosus]
MDLYMAIKYVHVISSTIIFGTGLGTAFQMWTAHRRGDVRAIAVVARNVVRADWYFTTPAVIVQPLSGAAMMHLAGFQITDGWLALSLGLYVLTGACWLPVVWLQIRAARLAEQAAATGQPLPKTYHHILRLWFLLGWPAFIAVLVIFWLMLAKPIL